MSLGPPFRHSGAWYIENGYSAGREVAPNRQAMLQFVPPFSFWVPFPTTQTGLKSTGTRISPFETSPDQNKMRFKLAPTGDAQHH